MRLLWSCHWQRILKSSFKKTRTISRFGLLSAAGAMMTKKARGKRGKYQKLSFSLLKLPWCQWTLLCFSKNTKAFFLQIQSLFTDSIFELKKMQTIQFLSKTSRGKEPLNYSMSTTLEQFSRKIKSIFMLFLVALMKSKKAYPCMRLQLCLVKIRKELRVSSCQVAKFQRNLWLITTCKTCAWVTWRTCMC